MTYYIGTASVWGNYDHAIAAENFDATINEGKTVCGRNGRGQILLRRTSRETIVQAHTISFRTKNDYNEDYNTETVACFKCEAILEKVGA